MARVWTALLALVVLSIGSTGCQNKMYDENKALRQQNQELQSQLDTAHTRSDVGPVNSAPLVQNAPLVAQTQPTMPQDTSAAAPPRNRARPDLGNLEVTEDPAAGTTTVSLPGDVFFDSGRAMLKESSKKSLDKVVSALKKEYANKPVRIDGHTDSDPIVHSKWKSNQELSEKRAQAVRDYLVSKGIDESRLSTRGLGDTKPRSTTNKAMNRRVEVVVLTR